MCHISTMEQMVFFSTYLKIILEEASERYHDEKEKYEIDTLK